MCCCPDVDAVADFQPGLGSHNGNNNSQREGGRPCRAGGPQSHPRQRRRRYGPGCATRCCSRSRGPRGQEQLARRRLNKRSGCRGGGMVVLVHGLLVYRGGRGTPCHHHILARHGWRRSAEKQQEEATAGGTRHYLPVCRAAAGTAACPPACLRVVDFACCVMDTYGTCSLMHLSLTHEEQDSISHGPPFCPPVPWLSLSIIIIMSSTLSTMSLAGSLVLCVLHRPMRPGRQHELRMLLLLLCVVGGREHDLWWWRLWRRAETEVHEGRGRRGG